MKIICSTVVRAAKQGDIHGGLYVIDVDSEEIVHYSPYAEDFVNDNERGGERGLRGITVLDDRIVVADSGGLIELDKETFQIVRRFSDDKIFKSIHEICYFDNNIWVTSTAYDSIASVDLDFKLSGLWEVVGENRSDYKALLGLEQINPGEAPEDDNFHINSISAYDNTLVFGGLITHLYDFKTMDVINPMPMIERSKSFQHNFYEYPGFYAVNLTTFGYLGLIKSDDSVHTMPNSFNNESTTIERTLLKTRFVALPKAKKVKYHADEIAKANWNRGLARHEDFLFVGSSPARIIMFNMNDGKIEKTIQLEEDIRHCIHGLEILE